MFSTCTSFYAERTCDGPRCSTLKRTHKNHQRMLIKSYSLWKEASAWYFLLSFFNIICLSASIHFFSFYFIITIIIIGLPIYLMEEKLNV